MKNEKRSEGFWPGVWRQFRKNRIASAGLTAVLVLFVIAAAADFIASDAPLVMKYEGRLYFPVLKEYSVWLGLSQWERQFQNIRFKEFAKTNFKPPDWAQFPPIPYSPSEVNLSDRLRRPSRQHCRVRRSRHQRLRMPQLRLRQAQSHCR